MKRRRQKPHSNTRSAPMEYKRDLSARGGLQLRAASINEEARTVEAVVTTDAPVAVFDMRTFSVIDETLRMDGAKVPPKAPLLASHDRSNINAVLGTVRGFQVGGNQISATLEFARDDPDADRAWAKVRDKHIDSVSIGYEVRGYEDIPAGETRTVAGHSYTAKDTTLRVSTDWEIREVSLVVIPADSGAKVRQSQKPQQKKETEMDERVRKFLESLGLRADATEAQAYEFLAKLEEKQRAEAEGKAKPEPKAEPKREATPQVDTEAIRLAAIAEDRARAAAIRELAGDDIDRELVDRAIAEGWDETRASKEFLKAYRAAGSEAVPQTGPCIRVSEGPTSEAISDGLALRAKAFPKHDPNASNDRKLEIEKRHEQAERYSTLPLIDIARLAITMDGRTVPINRNDIIERAFSGGSLSNIFTTSINAILLNAYADYPDTTVGWTSERDLSNFLTQERIAGTGAGRLGAHAEGGEAQHLDLGDLQETYKPKRFTGQIVIDEIAIIDDAVDLFTRVPVELGRAAARIRPDMVYYLLLANGNLGQDSTALFDASDHKNYGTTGTTLAQATLAAGIAAMAKQRDAQGIPLNIMPTHLLVPQDLWFTAENLLQSAQLLGSSGGVYNPLASKGVMPVSDDRIGVAGVTDPASGTAQAGTATNWFLASANANTIEVGYVTGRTPRIRPFTLDKGKWGVGWDVSHDVGACVLDYRGLYKATGAGG